MNMLPFTFAGIDFQALPSGALWWPDMRRLLVADLHLGKSERLARRGGALLPPYEVAETLHRLARDLKSTHATEVVCLGDSFDDNACAAHLRTEDRSKLKDLQAGRRWVWITGNHDPHVHTADCYNELKDGHILLRHIAREEPFPNGVSGEISGHYHPKHTLPTRGGRVARRCVLVTPTRVILPAYGAYTGGLSLSDPAFTPLVTGRSYAILVGSKPVLVPLATQAAAE